MEPPGREGRQWIFGRTLSNVAIHDGLVIAPELDGYVDCLDARTGKKYWEHETEAETWGAPYWVDGKVYIGNDDNKVFIFHQNVDCETVSAKLKRKK